MSDSRDRLSRLTGLLRDRGVSNAARLFFASLFERFGRKGMSCYETQKRLADQLSVPVRTLRLWEAEITKAGLWRREARGRGRELIFLTLEECGSGLPPITGSPQPANTGNGLPVTPAADCRSEVPPIRKEQTERSRNRSRGAAAESSEAGIRTALTSKFEAVVRRLGVEPPGLRVVLEGGAEYARRSASVFPDWAQALIERVGSRKTPPAALVASFRNGEADAVWEEARANVNSGKLDPLEGGRAGVLWRLHGKKLEWVAHHVIGAGATGTAPGDGNPRRSAMSAMRELDLTKQDLVEVMEYVRTKKNGRGGG